MSSKPQPKINVKCPDCDLMFLTRQGVRRHRRTVHGIVPNTKDCTKCETSLPLSNFKQVRTAAGTPTFSSACRACVGEKAETVMARRAARKASHVRRDRAHQARRYFGLSLEQYDAAVADFKQKHDNKCAICQQPDPNHLDHDHETGHLRGLLCRRCNLALGYLKDNPLTAEAAARYLRETKKEG